MVPKGTDFGQSGSGHVSFGQAGSGHVSFGQAGSGHVSFGQAGSGHVSFGHSEHWRASASASIVFIRTLRASITNRWFLPSLHLCKLNPERPGCQSTQLLGWFCVFVVVNCCDGVNVHFRSTSLSPPNQRSQSATVTEPLMAAKHCPVAKLTMVPPRLTHSWFVCSS